MDNWCKDAIIYQLHVKAFCDSNGDGIGDFRGLWQKLDYLQDLGVNCLWILPFYPSPLKDDGYDVADYCAISNTDDRYRQARIIFLDTETSNWTWDPVAKAYYWHRFFSHQPDLNYENPALQEAMLDVIRFWLNRGVDGIRCDAVPYLFEREDTICENTSHANWNSAASAAGSLLNSSVRPPSRLSASSPTS